MNSLRNLVPALASRSRFPLPASRFPLPASRFPLPASRFPLPASRFSPGAADRRGCRSAAAARRQSGGRCGGPRRAPAPWCSGALPWLAAFNQFCRGASQMACDPIGFCVVQAGAHVEIPNWSSESESSLSIAILQAKVKGSGSPGPNSSVLPQAVDHVIHRGDKASVLMSRRQKPRHVDPDPRHCREHADSLHW